MQRLIRAEFGPERFVRSMGVSERLKARGLVAVCQMSCVGPLILDSSSHDREEAGEHPSASQPATGTAFLDVCFRQDFTQAAEAFGPRMADLGGDGKNLELTVTYPVAFLQWFEGIIGDVRTLGGVLRFFGWLNGLETRDSGNLKVGTDALGRLSDRPFSSVSLSRQQAEIEPLAESERRESTTEKDL